MSSRISINLDGVIIQVTPGNLKRHREILELIVPDGRSLGQEVVWRLKKVLGVKTDAELLMALKTEAIVHYENPRRNLAGTIRVLLYRYWQTYENN